MAKDKVITHLVCENCKMRNYTQKVGKKRKPGTLALKKYCGENKCRGHFLHKETK